MGASSSYRARLSWIRHGAPRSIIGAALFVAACLTGAANPALAAPCPALAIAPKASTILLNNITQTVPFTATFTPVGAVAPCGAPVDVTAATLWSSANPAVGDFSSPNSNVLNVTGPGTATVTGSYLPPNAQVPLTDTAQVTANAVLSITVTPGQTTLATGGTQAYTASALLSNDTTLDVTNNVTWTSSDTTSAAFAGNVLTALAIAKPANIVVTATYQASKIVTVTGTAQAAINAAPQAPVANAGGSRSVPDTDGVPGEWVILNGSASTSTNGAITAYQWTDGQRQSLGTGTPLRVRLPDGADTITLTVTDSTGLTGATTIVITVGATPKRTVLQNLPGLSRNQRSTAQALDSMCLRLAQSNVAAPVAGDQADLLSRCNGVIFDQNQANQVGAVAAMTPDDFNAFRAAALVFTESQFTNVLDRMMALRGGARGLSIGDLSLNAGTMQFSLAQVTDIVKQVLGGGASADEPGSLLGDRWGLWMRGNYGRANEDANSADAGFDGHQWTATIGSDYRFGPSTVAGLAIGLARSGIDFRSGRGNLDTHVFDVTAYGSRYLPHNIYVDAFANYSHATYATGRTITYQEGATTITRTADGSTRGTTLGGGVTVGYDFAAGGLTITPMAGYKYTRATVDAFAESGAAGLDLAVDDQVYRSSSASLGFQANYAWRVPFGVVLPHLRVQRLHEFQDQESVLGMHFVADPFAMSATPTPPIEVHNEAPNNSYWRLAAGVSAQFAHGIAAYAEYQRLQNYGALTYGDLAVGLRMQTRF